MSESSDHPIIVNFLGILGNSFAIILFLLPIIIMKDMIKTKATNHIPWLLFFFTILNCEFWMIYGLEIKAWPVYLCNGFGFVTNQIYLILFCIYLENTKLLQKLIYICLLLFSFSTIFVFFYYYIQNKELCGGIACTMNILMFASPLQKLREVYEKKDNTYIPIHISVCLVLSCIIWTTYGIFKKMDWFIIIPNALGLFLSVFQVYLWFEFKEETERRQLEKSTRTNDQHGDGSGDELKSVEVVITNQENTAVNNSTPTLQNKI
jgi:solute carrier family 50 protein (sugar transporter)